MGGDGSEFLFVNFNSNSDLKSKSHLGRVNAHVHAHARAQKKRQDVPKPFAPAVAQRFRKRPPEAVLDRSIIVELSDDQWTPRAADERESRSSTDECEVTLTPNASSIATSPIEPGTFTPARLLASSKLSRSHKSRDSKQRGKGTSHAETKLRTDRLENDSKLKVSIINTTTPSNGLDPFVVFPINTNNVQDRQMLQFYFESLGPSVYGTRKDASFDPAIHITFPNVLNNDLVLKWVVICVEAHIAQRRGLPEPPNMLLRRKADAYRTMNERLRDPDADLEDLFGGMLAAVVQDSRVTGPHIASLHLRGLESILQKRGGMEVLFSDKKVVGSAILFVWAHHLSSDAGGIEGDLQLSEYKHNFLQSLRQIRDYNRFLKAKFSNIRRLAPQGSFELPQLSRGSQNPRQELELYYASWQKVFSVGSIRLLLDPDYPCSTFTEKTCHFSNLYSLNLTLWIFRKDYTKSALFLDRARQMFERNGKTDLITGLSSLTASYLLWTIARSRASIEEDMISREVYASWRIIQALKIRSLLGEATQRKLMCMLSNGLLAEQEENFVDLSDTELEEMDWEITQNWLTKGITEYTQGNG